MVFKAIILCVSALLIQNILGQSIDNVINDSCDCKSDSINSESDISVDSIDLSSKSSNADSSNIGNILRNIGIDSCNTGRPSSMTSSLLKRSDGSFFITCTGPVAPSGIKVDANSNLVGELLITGQLPFLSAVRFDSSFPTNGQASVAYGCGDGSIGIQNIIGGSAASSKSGVSRCNKFY